MRDNAHANLQERGGRLGKWPLQGRGSGHATPPALPPPSSSSFLSLTGISELAPALERASRPRRRRERHSPATPLARDSCRPGPSAQEDRTAPSGSRCTGKAGSGRRVRAPLRGGGGGGGASSKMSFLQARRSESALTALDERACSPRARHSEQHAAHALRKGWRRRGEEGEGWGWGGWDGGSGK